MKASELIEKLKKTIEKYGDSEIKVKIYDSEDDCYHNELVSKIHTKIKSNIITSVLILDRDTLEVPY